MDGVDTNFTHTVHRTAYPAISPTRPELSLQGKTVLITGGATGIGKSIARSFGLASAATVIIVARRVDLLKAAAAELESNAKAAKSPTKFIFRDCDITNSTEATALWDDLAAQGITVDILVLNAAKFTEPRPLLELGLKEVWSQFEVNVKGPLQFAERFHKQTSDSKRVILNVSTQAIHMLQHEIVAARPAYSLTKGAGTFALQLVASSITPDKMQIVSFHPGLIHGQGWIDAGVSKDMLPFDEDDLPGAFAVWAASKEAEFLHGRFVWASWDVTELARGETRRQIDENPDYLRFGVIGLKGAHRA